MITVSSTLASCILFNLVSPEFDIRVKILDRNLAKLYEGDPLNATIGLIGSPALCALLKA